MKNKETKTNNNSPKTYMEDGNLFVRITNPKNGNVSNVLLALGGKIELDLNDEPKTFVAKCPKSGDGIVYKISWHPIVKIVEVV